MNAMLHPQLLALSPQPLPQRVPPEATRPQAVPPAEVVPLFVRRGKPAPAFARLERRTHDGLALGALALLASAAIGVAVWMTAGSAHALSVAQACDGSCVVAPP
jgi:hypothetical protein